MRPQDLIAGLTQPSERTRMRAAYLLGTLEEATSLAALRVAFDNETDEDARAAIQWAGKRVKKATIAGFDTIQAMFDFFGIERAIQKMISPHEARLLESIQYSSDMSALSKSPQILGGRKAIQDTLRTIQKNNDASATAFESLSNMEVQPNRRFGLMYTPPREPSKDDIKASLRTLATDMDAKVRQEAVMELHRINNLAALPHLAQSFVEDIAPDVQADAERIAKQLYWNAMLWRMHRDGSIDREIEKRARELGKIVDSESGPRQDVVLTEPKPEEIDDILRKAEEARKKRKRR